LIVIVRQTVHEPLTRLTCFIVGLALVVNGSFTFDNWFQSETQAKFSVYAQNAAFIAVTVLRIIFLYLGAGLLAFAWAVSAEPILAAILSLILFRAVVGPLSGWRFDAGLARKWFVEAWPLLLTGLAIIVYTRIDQIMLAYLASDHALGIYSAAVKVSEVSYFVPGILATSFFPSIVRTRALGTEAYNISPPALFRSERRVSCRNRASNNSIVGTDHSVALRRQVRRSRADSLCSCVGHALCVYRRRQTAISYR
jgi:O-antigen/teichoic acid export membrane protein